MEPPDFKLDSLFSLIPPDVYDVLDAFESPDEEVRGVVKSFSTNCKRIHALSFMPFVLYNRAWFYGLNHGKASVDMVGGFEAASADHPDFYEAKKKAYLASHTDMADPAKNQGTHSQLLKDGVDDISIMSRFTPDFDMIRPWLASLLTGVWTTFEVLATDLWVASVNARPTGLGLPALRVQPKKGNKEPAAGDETADGEPGYIPLDTLRQYGYDLSASMGLMLKDQNKWSFNGAASLKNAYGDAFGADIKSLFEEAEYKSVEILEAIRNLLVHRAGLVDAKFLNRVKRHELYSQLTKGSRIEIDGEMIRESTTAVVVFSVKLIDFVDRWVSDHPE